MKKFIGIFLIGFLLFGLVSCSKSVENPILKVAENICLREGKTIDGKMVISSKDFVGFYSENPQNNKIYLSKARLKKQSQPENKYQLTFKLTDEGKKLFSEETAKLARTNICLSLWIGDELIFSPRVVTQITDGTFIMANTDLNAESFNTLCNKLQGKPNK